MIPKINVLTITPNPAIDQTITIANFQPGAVNRATEIHNHPGGKGINVAAALADFGMEVAASGFLGKESHALFEKLFTQKKIRDYFIQVEGTTRTSIKITDPAKQETTDINLPGHHILISHINALFDTAPQINTEWCVLAGSLPPGTEKTFYKELIPRLKQRGCKIALDADGDALRFGLEAKPDLIKPNIFELESITGHKLNTPHDIVPAARKVIQQGIGKVMVSMGAQGAILVTETKSLLAVPEKIKVRSTVGAGDAMLAGLVTAELGKFPLEDGARLATAFALKAISKLGPGLPSRSEVLEAQTHVKVNTLNY